jgi:hypothetical protein
LGIEPERKILISLIRLLVRRGFCPGAFGYLRGLLRFASCPAENGDQDLQQSGFFGCLFGGHGELQMEFQVDLKQENHALRECGSRVGFGRRCAKDTIWGLTNLGQKLTEFWVPSGKQKRAARRVLLLRYFWFDLLIS